MQPQTNDNLVVEFELARKCHRVHLPGRRNTVQNIPVHMQAC
jgi:hypothetical protein